jgi:shikimate kinase
MSNDGGEVPVGEAASSDHPVTGSPCHRVIFLVGYRGTGKSAVARLLAARLGWDWVDADALLEERAGRSIRAVFAAEGEAGFRDREEALLAELARRGDCVIATGGGVVLRPANRERLRAGRVVWLTADADTIRRRLRQDPGSGSRRPPLLATAADDRAEIEELLRIREPLYREVAGLTVDTVGRPPEAVADEIVRSLGLSPDDHPV